MEVRYNYNVYEAVYTIDVNYGLGLGYGCGFGHGYAAGFREGKVAYSYTIYRNGSFKIT